MRNFPDLQNNKKSTSNKGKRETFIKNDEMQ